MMLQDRANGLDISHYLDIPILHKRQIRLL